MNNLSQLASDMMLLGTYEDHDDNTIISVLKHCDDLYFNKGEPCITDEDYDALRRYTEKRIPEHSYFTGSGSEVKGKKVKLPYPMGSLDQIYEGEIEDWVKKWNLYDDYVGITDKLDGTSALVIYNPANEFNIAYSKGDGVEGDDISRHIRKIVPFKLHGNDLILESIHNTGNYPLVIRGEVIISEHSFRYLKEEITTRAGNSYKNPRNLVAGLMNAKENSHLVYQNLSFIVYEIVNIPDLSKQEQLSILHEYGFETPHVRWVLGSALSDEFLANLLNERREASSYQLDGLVIDVAAVWKRNQMNPTRDTLNPAYSVKYKVASADNIANTTVTEVEWNLSKDRFFKPRVKIEPVDLMGVTITYATGFNAKFIHDNKVGPGARIEITRAGDVIPFIQKVLEGTEAQMPEGDWIWNETEVDAVLVSHKEHEEVVIQQVIHFFTSLNIDNLKEGTIRKLFDEYHFESFTEATYFMLLSTEDSWIDFVGKNGQKIYNSIRSKEISSFTFLGATPFFGRGVGARKFKKLINTLKLETIDSITSLTINDIVSVDGFDTKTANKILNGIDDFLFFYGHILTNGVDLNIIHDISSTGGVMNGEKVVFTGFRDKDLSVLVEKEGGTIQSGVSGKTTILVAKNPNSNSGKMKKARDKGIRILGIDEFKELLL